MTELVNLLAFLYDAGAAVIPWLLLAVFVLLLIRTWPNVLNYIEAKTEAARDVAAREAERNEIMRNNSAVIQNNTETMQVMRRFIEDTNAANCGAIEKHEDMSAERMERMQAVLDDNKNEIGKLRGDVGILLDRVKPNN